MNDESKAQKQDRLKRQQKEHNVKQIRKYQHKV